MKKRKNCITKYNKKHNTLIMFPATTPERKLFLNFPKFILSHLKVPPTVKIVKLVNNKVKLKKSRILNTII